MILLIVTGDLFFFHVCTIEQHTPISFLSLYTFTFPLFLWFSPMTIPKLAFLVGDSPVLVIFGEQRIDHRTSIASPLFLDFCVQPILMIFFITTIPRYSTVDGNLFFFHPTVCFIVGGDCTEGIIYFAPRVLFKLCQLIYCYQPCSIFHVTTQFTKLTQNIDVHAISWTHCIQCIV